MEESLYDTSRLIVRKCGGRSGVKTKVMEIQSDINIMKQLEEGKKEGTKVRDFEELAKELGI